MSSPSGQIIRLALVATYPLIIMWGALLLSTAVAGAGESMLRLSSGERSSPGTLPARGR